MSNNDISNSSNEKPTAAFVLSLVGAIFVFIGGLAIVALGAILNQFGGGILAGFGLIGVVWGVLMLAGGILLYLKPAQHQGWGALILIGSILSWFGALGGIFIGFLLGLIGGILGIAWKPNAITPNPNTNYNTTTSPNPNNFPARQN
jgi:hypothetical protein